MTGGWEGIFQRLDASPEWLPWAPPEEALPVAYVGDGCMDPWPLNMQGQLALVVPGSLNGSGSSQALRCSPALLVR